MGEKFIGVSMNLAEFFYMGGYAFYVWTSYGITFLILLFNIVSPIWQRKKLLRSLALKQQRSNS
jgi:heme exporter protein D